MRWIALAFALFALLGRAARQGGPERTSDVDWPVSGGSPANTHYSPLKQINRSNAGRVQAAWSFDTGERGGLETTPIVVDGMLYAFTPALEVIALDPASGKLLWKFKSGVVGTRPSRALTYWRDGNDERIFAGIMNFVYALNAKTGLPIREFGEDGRIDLREGLGREPAAQSMALTSPGVIYKDMLIVGDATPETLPAPPGDIRAYDVLTGRVRWTFHTIPHPGEFGYNTWPEDAWTYSGAANNWAGMAVDVERGIVYVPTGSAATDWYGADRVGDDLFSDTLLALDANTGKRVWHFQGVRHDLWDRDFPAPPDLVTLRRNGKDIPAVVQTTKQGFIYVFDRTTGKPLFPIEYRKVPASAVPGEATAEMQPFVLKPAPLVPQQLTEDGLTTRSPAARQWAIERFRELISGGQFVPIGVGKETVIFPGADGGGEWGGAAVDPETKILYVNANQFAHTESLERQVGRGGRSTYEDQCASCHGEDRAGIPPSFPSLIDIQERRSPEQIAEILRTGQGRMPSFPGIIGKRRSALIAYLLNGEPKGEGAGGAITYVTNGYHRFNDPEGYPANATPWGTLNAINLNTGEYLWKIPFGEYPELVAQGMKETGSENYGGPVVTAGGLLIIGATVFDNKVRIYDKSTGKLLWEKVLPFAVNATPATYAVKGRQYIVFAAGGSGRNPKAPTGGVYFAFALPG